MVEVKIDNMSFSWKTKEEFEQVKECLEILRTTGIEIERIKAANARIREEHKKQMRQE